MRDMAIHNLNFRKTKRIGDDHEYIIRFTYAGVYAGFCYGNCFNHVDCYVTFVLVTVLQVLLLLGLTILSQNIAAIKPIFITAQVVLSGIVVYKFIKAIDMNYRIVLEKTHQTRPDLITDESKGSRFSF